MTQRPGMESDDTTTSYSPPPVQRPSWAYDPRWQQPQVPANPGYQPPYQTPPHWIERQGVSGPPPRRPPERRPSRAGAVAGIVLVSLLSAGLAAGGTYALLDAGGRLDPDAAAAATPAGQQTSTGSREQNVTVNEESAITDAASAVSPAVVTITSTSADATDPLSVPQTGVGSGIIYDGGGWVLTNRHVVCGADELRVHLADGHTYSARTYGVDTLTDLAIVRIQDASDLPVAELGDSSALKAGQLAVAIGSPLGTYTNSVTSGVISAMGRRVTVDDSCGDGRVALNNLIQTDAAINPGNSGGALVDSTGRVVGVNTAVAGDAQGIGFAIPINIAKPIMEQAVEGERLTRPWLGIYYQEVDPALVEAQDLPIDYGVLVAAQEGNRDPAVLPDSPAAEAGVRARDIITAIDGERIDATRGLDDLLTRYRAGDEITLTVVRGGETLELALTLGERPANL
jgi:serine protease Do